MAAGFSRISNAHLSNSIVRFNFATNDDADINQHVFLCGSSKKCCSRNFLSDYRKRTLSHRWLAVRKHWPPIRKAKKMMYIVPFASVDDNTAVNGTTQANPGMEEMRAKLNQSLQGESLSRGLVQLIHDVARSVELAILEHSSSSKTSWFSKAWLGVDKNAWVKTLSYQVAVYALLQAVIEISSRGDRRDKDTNIFAQRSLLRQCAPLENVIREELSTKQPAACEWFWAHQNSMIVATYVNLFEKDPRFAAATLLCSIGESSGDTAADITLLTLALSCLASIKKLGSAKLSCSQFFLMVPDTVGRLMDMLLDFLPIQKTYYCMTDIGLRREFLFHFGPRATTIKNENDCETEEREFWIDLVQNQLERAIDREKICSRLTTCENIEILKNDLAIFGFFIALGRSTQSFLTANGVSIINDQIEGIIRYLIGGSVLYYPQLSSISSYQLFVEVVCEELEWIPFYQSNVPDTKLTAENKGKPEGIPYREAISLVLEVCSYWMTSFIKYSAWLDSPSNIKAARFLSKGHSKLIECVNEVGITKNRRKNDIVAKRKYKESDTYLSTDQGLGSFEKIQAVELSRLLHGRYQIHLDAEHEEIEEYMKQHEKYWDEYGCTLMCDGWSTQNRRKIINFLVYSTYGTVFIDSVDATDEFQSADYICSLMDDMVERIGESRVVQVVTDNGANYKAGGHLLMEKRKHLYWTLCAAHCIDLILEDMAKQEEVKNVIDQCQKITGYIYNHGWLLSMTRKETGQKELIRSAITRFATHFIALNSIYTHRDDLKRMVLSRGWMDKIPKLAAKDRTIAFRVQTMIQNEIFWNDIASVIVVFEPLVKVLRMVDSDDKAEMGYLYEAMDRAKESIRHNFGRGYKKWWNITDKRWDKQLHRDIHAAGYFLNPAIQYSNNVENDNEVLTGFRHVVNRLEPDIFKQLDIDREALESVEEALVRLEDLLHELNMSNSNPEHLKAACSDLERMRKLKKEAEFLEASFRAKAASLEQGEANGLSASSGSEQSWFSISTGRASKENKSAQNTAEREGKRPHGFWSFLVQNSTKKAGPGCSTVNQKVKSGILANEDSEINEIYRFELLRRELIELERRVQRSTNDTQNDEELELEGKTASAMGKHMVVHGQKKTDVIAKSIEKIKETSTDVWQGTQLLGIDVAAAMVLLKRSVTGDELTEKEKKALRRTLTDLASVLPIGFLMLLPVTAVGHAAMLAAIQRYVPALIPSTYGPERLDLLRQLEKVKELETAEITSEEMTEAIGSPSSSSSNSQ